MTSMNDKDMDSTPIRLISIPVTDVRGLRTFIKEVTGDDLKVHGEHYLAKFLNILTDNFHDDWDTRHLHVTFAVELDHDVFCEFISATRDIDFLSYGDVRLMSATLAAWVEQLVWCTNDNIEENVRRFACDMIEAFNKLKLGRLFKRYRKYNNKDGTYEMIEER